MKTTLIAAAAIAAATLSSCSGAKSSTLTRASFRQTASDKTEVAATDSSQTLIELRLEDPVLDWRFPEAQPDSSENSNPSEFSESSPPPRARLKASRLTVRLSNRDFRRLTIAHVAADSTAADTVATVSSQSPPPAAEIAAKGLSTVRLIFLVCAAGLLCFFFLRAARHLPPTP